MFLTSSSDRLIDMMGILALSKNDRGAGMAAEQLISSAKTTDELVEAFKYIHGYFLYDSRRPLMDKMIKASFKENSFKNLERVIGFLAWDEDRYSIDLSVDHLDMDDASKLSYYSIVYNKASYMDIVELRDFIFNKVKKIPRQVALDSIEKGELPEALRAAWP